MFSYHFYDCFIVLVSYVVIFIINKQIYTSWNNVVVRCVFLLVLCIRFDTTSLSGNRMHIRINSNNANSKSLEESLHVRFSECVCECSSWFKPELTRRQEPPRNHIWINSARSIWTKYVLEMEEGTLSFHTFSFVIVEQLKNMYLLIVRVEFEAKTEPSKASNHMKCYGPHIEYLFLNYYNADLMHTELPPSSLDLSYDGSQSPGSGGSLSQQTRNKRMRTSFKHHQLRTMKSYFAINQNPDAKDLKQLSQKTGLSKRVLQVHTRTSHLKVQLDAITNFHFAIFHLGLVSECEGQMEA